MGCGSFLPVYQEFTSMESEQENTEREGEETLSTLPLPFFHFSPDASTY